MKKFIEIFDLKYAQLHQNLCEIIDKTPTDKLFLKPLENNSLFSVGENVLRSAGKVEQTFGGIMTRLWDDPFEWTLPEELSTKEKVLEYLNEVEATRKKGFEFFNSDEDLKKELPAPEQIKTLFEILLETLTIAENLRGRALIAFQLVSGKTET